MRCRSLAVDPSSPCSSTVFHSTQRLPQGAFCFFDSQLMIWLETKLARSIAESNHKQVCSHAASGERSAPVVAPSSSRHAAVWLVKDGPLRRARAGAEQALGRYF